MADIMEQKIPATVIVMAVLVIIATGIAILSVMGSQETNKPVPSDTGVKTNLPDPVMTSVITPVTMAVTEKPAAGQPTPAPILSTGIRLDPIGDVYDGQEYLITGTTSLPIGTELLLQLMPDTGTPPKGTDKHAIGGSSSSTAWITQGDGILNRIRIEGSMGGQPPGKWVALVGEMKGSYSDFQIGDHYGYAYFTLK